jgi:hypothetical protein
MKMLIYEHFLNNIPDLVIDLIPMGLECIEFNSKDNLLDCLKKDLTIPLILTGTQEFGLLKEIKEINPAINIFYMSKKMMKPEEIKSLTPISRIINFSQNTAHVAEEIVKCVIGNNIHKKDQRVHVRVRPKETEIIESAVCIKELRKYIKGKVIDISAGGCAIKFNDPAEAALLAPKTVYDPLLIIINRTGIKSLATLIAIRNGAAGFHFDNIEQGGMRKIAAYIYKRILENTKE